MNNYASAQALIGTNKMIFAPLTSSLTINQYSYVVYEIPTSTLSEPAGGSYLNWDAPDNLTATISYDGGNNWTPIVWDSYMFNYNNNIYLENVLVKFEFNQKYNDIQPLRLTFFEYGIYNSYPMVSDFRNYSLYPATSSAYNTHSFRHYDNKIIFRPENFGINFKADISERVLGYATASSSTTPSYGIDFWVRIDDLQKSLSFTSSVNNLTLNPNFEVRASTGWSASLWQYGGATGSVLSGGLSGSAIFVKGNGTIQDVALSSIGWIKVEKGDILYIESWVKVAPGTNGTFYPLAFFGFQSSSALSATHPYNSLNNVTTASTVTADIWIKYSASFQIPGSSDLAWVSPWVSVRNNSTTGSVAFDNIIVRKQPNSIYLLNTSSYSLSYAASNSLLQFASAAPMFVYVNGASVTNSSYKLLANEYYHIAISSSSPVSILNINGGVMNSGSYNANATYGHISIWNTIPSLSDVQNRYNLFISNVIQTASMQDNTLFLIGSSYYDSASAYKTGTLML